jgi:DnaJ-class molecular chaperone
MKAKTLLGLRETSSLKEIKTKYKKLMKKWHPDKHKDEQDKATTMSAQINDAYETVMEYCNNYEYSFDEESVKKSTYSPSEWWHDKFGGR